MQVALARNAMATRFEIVLPGENAVALRAAGEEALDEIVRLENQLSLYRPHSEIAQVNARAAREPVGVTAEVFALLQRAQRLHQETHGAFDISVAPLVRAWGFMHNAGCVPSESNLAAALACVGMHHIQLDERHLTVRFDRDGVMLDLGAIGKGYAVERAAAVLRESGVHNALIHGGTSTVCALGQPEEGCTWNIAVDVTAELARGIPSQPGAEREPSGSPASPDQEPVSVTLTDESLSVSSPSGRQFEAGGRSFGHVLDPRSGQPVAHSLLAAVISASPTDTDAFSTALLVLGRQGLDSLAALRRGMRIMLAEDRVPGYHVHKRGF